MPEIGENQNELENCPKWIENQGLTDCVSN